MTTLWAVLGAIFATLIGKAILGGLVSEEIRGRLDRLPYVLINLAARRLPLDVREDLAEEWGAELHEILGGAEALPLTRLYRGIQYGFGLLRAAPRIGHEISTSTVSPRAGGKPSDFRRRLVHLLVTASEEGITALLVTAPRLFKGFTIVSGLLLLALVLVDLGILPSSQTGVASRDYALTAAIPVVTTVMAVVTSRVSRAWRRRQQERIRIP